MLIVKLHPAADLLSFEARIVIHTTNLFFFLQFDFLQAEMTF